MKTFKKITIVLAVIFWAIFCTAVLAQAQTKQSTHIAFTHGRKVPNINWGGASDKLQDARKDIQRDSKGFAVINPVTKKPYTKREWEKTRKMRFTSHIFVASIFE